jgi:hypothetical protein
MEDQDGQNINKKCMFYVERESTEVWITQKKEGPKRGGTNEPKEHTET